MPAIGRECHVLFTSLRWPCGVVPAGTSASEGWACPSEAAKGHSKCAGNILLRRVVLVPFKNLCYFPPQAWGLALMERLPGSGAKDGKGLRMKRPSLWTGHSSAHSALSPEISGGVLRSALARSVQKGEVGRSEVIGLNSQSWEKRTLPRSSQVVWLRKKNFLFVFFLSHDAIVVSQGSWELFSEILGNGRCLLKFVGP